MTEQAAARIAVPPSPASGKPARWLLRRPREDAPARIFCFSYSGVGASMYAGWPSHAGPTEICLIQPPGRENRLREPHYGSYESLAEQLVEYLLPFLDRPLGFFGHCGGALPGFAATLLDPHADHDEPGAVGSAGAFRGPPR